MTESCMSVPARHGRERRRRAGLTLVEMIVVLAIIALVAALTVPNIIGRLDQAKAGAARTNIGTIKSALRVYRLDNGGYPTTEQGLKALVERPTTEPVPPNWNSGGYLEDLPEDPWGRPFLYRAPAASGAPYEILTLGRDGKEGGEGLDADLNDRS